MRRALFRLLGSIHGAVGLVTLFIVVSVGREAGVTSLATGPYKTLELPGGFVTIVSLIACAIATWRRPRFAPFFAWVAALAYILPLGLETSIVFGAAARSSVLVDFYYSGSIRLAAALALSLLYFPYRQRV